MPTNEIIQLYCSWAINLPAKREGIRFGQYFCNKLRETDPHLVDPALFYMQESLPALEYALERYADKQPSF